MNHKDQRSAFNKATFILSSSHVSDCCANFDELIQFTDAEVLTFVKNGIMKAILQIMDAQKISKKKQYLRKFDGKKRLSESILTFQKCRKIFHRQNCEIS